MLGEQEMAETLAAALAAGQPRRAPFPFTVFNPFPADLYAEILANRPADEFYAPLSHRDALRPDGTSTRLVLSLEPESVARLPAPQREFWSAFNAVMRSRAVCEVFLRHLEPELTARFGTPVSEIPCHPTARLGRDFDGYKITPHPDKQRVYTAQVYLAEDDALADVGTTVYERLADGRFSAVERLSFLPNTGFCFVPTERSFHGVEPISVSKPRQNLHISCFLKPTGF